LAEAENFVKEYFRRFPGVKHYLDRMRSIAAENGYVETLLGRRRYFLNLSSESNRQVRLREEREAINAPIQGTAADIMKIAMLALPRALVDNNLDAKILLQVHDELVLECPVDQVSKTATVVRNAMENAFTLDVPLITEAKHGKNWGELMRLQY
jgi:DNA polymerase-1